MDKRIRNIRDGAVTGGIIGGSIGTILAGVSLVIPGGKEFIIARMVSTATKTAATVTTLSGTAIGTLVGAVAGATVKDESPQSKPNKETEMSI